MTNRRFRHTALSSLALLGMLTLTACTLLEPAHALARVPPPVPEPGRSVETDGQDDDLYERPNTSGEEALVLAAHGSFSNPVLTPTVDSSSGLLAISAASLAWFVARLSQARVGW